MGRRSRAQDSAFAVIARGDRILLVRTWEGRWQLPGGRLLQGESHRDAAQREVHEETGLSVRILSRTGTYPRKDGTRARVYTAEAPRKARPVGPRNEIREQRWVSIPKAQRKLRRDAWLRLSDAIDSAG